ncbi:WD repeat-containing protein 91-like protein [Smittium culicis]|uniref:WD repeat-containing protein 91-like protein n=1 Tax=Smittium culicis TaxID=133412 RepID=A0A1R1Y4Z7_9FUNG|nr:WD repeat-containing protein 91-like protein [Smittium culicis]
MYKKRLLRYFIVSAVNKNKPDIILSFFKKYGTELAKEADWIPWLAITYVPEPNKRPEYEASFTEDWINALKLSLTDFIDSLFKIIETPKILNFESDRIEKLNLQTDIDILKSEIISLKNKIAALKSTSVKSTSFIPYNFKINSSSLNDSHLSKQNIAFDSINSLDIINTPSTSELISLSSPSFINSPTDNSLHTIIKPNRFIHPRDSPSLKLKSQSLFLEHSSYITFCQFSPDGSKIASIDEENFLKVWSHTGDTIPPVSRLFDNNVYCMTWDQLHPHLLYLYFDSGSVFALNVSNKVLHHHFDLPDPNNNLVFKMQTNPVNSNIAIITRPLSSKKNHCLFVYDTISNSLVSKKTIEFAKSAELVDLEFNHNGTLIAATISSGEIIIYDFTSDSPVIFISTNSKATLDKNGNSSLLNGDKIISGAFSFDENSFFLLTQSGKIDLGSLICALKPQSERVTALDFDSTGRYVLSSCQDGTVRVATVFKQ